VDHVLESVVPEKSSLKIGCHAWPASAEGKLVTPGTEGGGEGRPGTEGGGEGRPGTDDDEVESVVLEEFEGGAAATERGGEGRPGTDDDEVDSVALEEFEAGAAVGAGSAAIPKFAGAPMVLARE
jgi:hypothetical protein